jgi:hypothetical protein
VAGCGLRRRAVRRAAHRLVVAAGACGWWVVRREVGCGHVGRRGGWVARTVGWLWPCRAGWVARTVGGGVAWHGLHQRVVRRADSQLVLAACVCEQGGEEQAGHEVTRWPAATGVA